MDDENFELLLKYDEKHKKTYLLSCSLNERKNGHQWIDCELYGFKNIHEDIKDEKSVIVGSITGEAKKYKIWDLTIDPTAITENNGTTTLEFKTMNTLLNGKRQPYYRFLHP